MATLRNSYVPHLLIALGACSSADVITSGPVNGVLGVDITQCNGNQPCIDENITDVAIANGQAFIARFKNDPAGASNTVRIEVGDFGDGGVTDLHDEPTATDGQLSALSDGGVILVTSNGQPIVHDLGGFVLNVSSGGNLGGAVLAGGGFYFINADQGQGFSDPDESNWPSTGGSDGGIQSNVVNGSIVRVDLAAQTTSTVSGPSFVMTLSRHLLAADATHIYWVAGPEPGKVMQAPLDLSTSSLVMNVSNGVAAGLATNGTTLAWSATTLGAGCSIWAAGTLIFQTTAFSCMGLAIDKDHAYVAKVSSQISNNNSGTTTWVQGMALERVDLAGPSTQTASELDLASLRYYGPRRVLIDDTFVYGVDPAYVVRVAKTAFKP